MDGRCIFVAWEVRLSQRPLENWHPLLPPHCSYTPIVAYSCLCHGCTSWWPCTLGRALAASADSVDVIASKLWQVFQDLTNEWLIYWQLVSLGWLNSFHINTLWKKNSWKVSNSAFSVAQSRKNYDVRYREKCNFQKTAETTIHDIETKNVSLC
jgi:hypothetical protein